MSQFTDWSALDLRWRGDVQRWELLAPLRWEVGFVGSGDFVDVPVGFLTDLASVPRRLWSVIAPFGDHARAAVVHDWLYSQEDMELAERGRAWADRQFLEAMAASGVPLLRRRVMWLAVRCAGWWRWRKVS